MEHARKNGGGKKAFVRADTIDLKNLDAQLEKHLSRTWTLQRERETNTAKHDWEIDISKLVIQTKIACGTFGTVYKGRFNDQDVAVKLLNLGEDDYQTPTQRSAARVQFQQEVAVWHTLDHPNVTKFIGASTGSSDIVGRRNCSSGGIKTPPNSCCVVVEYLPGGTLKSYLIKNSRNKLSLDVVLQLALDLSRGLSYLHSKKIVHRDVKTENMLLERNRTVKIADFGVARVEATNPKDMTGETGTLGYMAPEVLNGKPYNRKCDVYSFGICLWEIYCCDMPYPNMSFTELSSAVVRHNQRPEIPRRCPSSLATVMKKCWDANPDKRPEMSEVVELLENIKVKRGRRMVPANKTPGCFCFLKLT